MEYLFLLILVPAVWGIFRPFSIGNYTASRAQFALAAFVAFVGIGVFAPSPENGENSGGSSLASSANVDGSDETDPGSEGKSELEKYAEQIKREVASMKDGNTLTDIPTDRNGIMISAAVIGARAKIYKDRPKHDDPEIKAIEKEFVTLSTAYQRDAFPKLRKAWADSLDEVMWENDIDVATFGTGNKKVRFTGGAFAANRNIKAAHEALGDTPRILRFSEEMYEWYRGSDYQSYKYDDALSDGEWATLVGSGWQKLEQP